MAECPIRELVCNAANETFWQTSCNEANKAEDKIDMGYKKKEPSEAQLVFFFPVSVLSEGQPTLTPF